VAYNKDQWISSFGDQLSILRPYVTGRPLASMCLSAWHQFGTKDQDPIKAADVSRTLDQQKPTKEPKK
jgi:hypothetical protein